MGEAGRGGRRRSGLWRAAILTVPLVLLALVAPSHATGPDAGRIAFTKPIVAIPTTTTQTGPLPALPMGEPQMLIAHDGRVLLTAQFQMWDCVTGKPLKSNGVTYQVQGTNPQRLCVWAARPGDTKFRLIGGDCCQNGDDASLGQTPRSGTILETYMSNIGAGPGVPGASISRSTDNGKHWTHATDFNTQLAQDRPFLLVASERNVLLSFTAPPGNIFVVRSSDQGKTWGLPEIVTPVPPEAVLSLNGEPTHDVARREIVLSYAHSSSRVASNISSTGGTLNVIDVARSTDGGKTWHAETAADLPAGGGVLSLPSMTSDSAGREYIAYDAPVGAHGTGAFIIRSTKDGSWTRPMRVDPPGGSAMEPSVRAIGDGHVAVAYYHSTASDAGDHVRRWKVDVAISDDAARHLRYGNASRHVVYVGTEADAQSTLFDLLAFAIDRHGAANVAWTSDGSAYPNNIRTRIEYAREIPGPED